MTDAAFPSRRGLTGDALKLLAILAMTLDHIAWLLFPGYPAQAMPLTMHIIGRLTCPIMCYFIAEGYHYTRNFRRYALRLFLLAIVSHFAYIYASNAYQDWRSFIPFYSGSVLNQTGVVWSLLGGLLMLRVNDLDCAVWKKAALILLLCLLTFPADWSCIAALCILSIGSNRGNPKSSFSGARSTSASTAQSIISRSTGSTVFYSCASSCPCRCCGSITAHAAKTRLSAAS